MGTRALDDAPAALLPALEAAVPLWIMQLAGTTFEQRHAMAQQDTQTIAEHGDGILYRTRSTAEAFNALARGLAVAAHQPGGVTFAGQHWCIDHAACREAEAGELVTPAPKRL